MRTLALLWILALAVCVVPPALAEDPAPAPTAPVNDTTPAEAELGKRTAEQIEKQFKLVKDDDTVKKLNAMAAEIAPHTDRPGVVYTCKILDIGALNAMALPGGTIYFTKGLLGAVESDHELAGVMAHEIAHNAMRHAKTLAEKEGKISLMQIATIIATVYANKSGDVPTGPIIAASELLKQALLNGYTVDLEIEADTKAVEYLHKTKKYDPVGLYSVMLGFRQIEQRHAFVEMGYLKTHPYANERKLLLENKLKALGIGLPPNIWNVVNFRAKAVPPAGENEKGHTLQLGDTAIITLTEACGEETAQVRVEDAAAAINRRLKRDYIQQFDIDADRMDGHVRILFRAIPVLTLTQADADAAGMTLDALGSQTVQRIKSSIWNEAVKRS